MADHSSRSRNFWISFRHQSQERTPARADGDIRTSLHAFLPLKIEVASSALPSPPRLYQPYVPLESPSMDCRSAWRSLLAHVQSRSGYSWTSHWLGEPASMIIEKVPDRYPFSASSACRTCCNMTAELLSDPLESIFLVFLNPAPSISSCVAA